MGNRLRSPVEALRGVLGASGMVRYWGWCHTAPRGLDLRGKKTPSGHYAIEFSVEFSIDTETLKIVINYNSYLIGNWTLS